MKENIPFLLDIHEFLITGLISVLRSEYQIETISNFFSKYICMEFAIGFQSLNNSSHSHSEMNHFIQSLAIFFATKKRSHLIRNCMKKNLISILHKIANNIKRFSSEEYLFIYFRALILFSSKNISSLLNLEDVWQIFFEITGFSS
jgi:hypothetical protein